MTGALQLAVDAKCTIGEGPVWDTEAQTLYWVDLLENRIHALEASSGRLSSLDVGQNTGCVVPRSKGGLVAALQHGFFTIDLGSGTLKPIHDPEADKPENRFNDGKCDSRGRLWAGTMSKKLDSGSGDSGPVGSLYCLEPDGKVSRKIADITLSNGLGWSPDDRLFYYIDSTTYTVAAYDFEPSTGRISGRRVVVRLPANYGGMPDGMCVDEEGLLWIALWGAGGVGRWDPATGQLQQWLAVPAPHVTSCAFGGDGLDELFVTTARLGTDTRAYPLAGGVFKAKLAVKGLPSYKFGG
jgi:sugar lactone lactonase YvrE